MTNQTTPNIMVPCLAFFALAIFAIASCDNSKTADATTDGEPQVQIDDKKDNSDFAAKAAQAGMYEVEMGKLAEMKGTSEEVKELGRMMAKDHGKANEELKALAARKNIVLPAGMSEKQQDDYDMLLEKKTEGFDKKYAAMMVDDHEKDLKLFKEQAEDGKDPDLSSWASGKVPVLEHHLLMAKTTRDGLK